MGCYQTKLKFSVSEHGNSQFICDLASRIAIDLISIYSDNTHTPLAIYMDESQYLFGKRIIKSAIINDDNLQISVRALRYVAEPMPIPVAQMDGIETPLEHLKEYLAMHNLLNFPVNIEYIIHDTKLAYFDIKLNDLT